MQANANFKPDTVEAFKKIYEEHKESVSFQARFCNPTEKAFAKTILLFAGVDLSCCILGSSCPAVGSILGGRDIL